MFQAEGHSVCDKLVNKDKQRIWKKKKTKKKQMRILFAFKKWKKRGL